MNQEKIKSKKRPGKAQIKKHFKITITVLPRVISGIWFHYIGTGWKNVQTELNLWLWVSSQMALARHLSYNLFKSCESIHLITGGTYLVPIINIFFAKGNKFWLSRKKLKNTLQFFFSHKSSFSFLAICDGEKISW